MVKYCRGRKLSESVYKDDFQTCARIQRQIQYQILLVRARTHSTNLCCQGHSKAEQIFLNLNIRPFVALYRTENESSFLEKK